MKYLSIDIEATGLEPNDLMIEFAAVPIDSQQKKIEDKLTFHSYIKCPSFKDLETKLSPWVAEHNKQLIETAHKQGKSLVEFKTSFEKYLQSEAIVSFFGSEKVILFGKSMSSIDLPFLKRDLGHQWMEKFFSHRNIDFTSVCFAMVDQGILSPGMESGSKLMNFLNMGEVCHTALDDAINTAKMYFRVLELAAGQRAVTT